MGPMNIEGNIFWTVENEVSRMADEKRKAEVTINPSMMKKTVAKQNVEEMTNPSATSHSCFWIAGAVDDDEAATTEPVTKS